MKSLKEANYTVNFKFQSLPTYFPHISYLTCQIQHYNLDSNQLLSASLPLQIRVNNILNEEASMKLMVPIVTDIPYQAMLKLTLVEVRQLGIRTRFQEVFLIDNIPSFIFVDIDVEEKSQTTAQYKSLELRIQFAVPPTPLSFMSSRVVITTNAVYFSYFDIEQTNSLDEKLLHFCKFDEGETPKISIELEFFMNQFYEIAQFQLTSTFFAVSTPKFYYNSRFQSLVTFMQQQLIQQEKSAYDQLRKESIFTLLCDFVCSTAEFFEVDYSKDELRFQDMFLLLTKASRQFTLQEFGEVAIKCSYAAFTNQAEFVLQPPEKLDIGDVQAFNINRNHVTKFDQQTRQKYGDILNIPFANRLLISGGNPSLCFVSAHACGHRVFDKFFAAVVPAEVLEIFHEQQFQTVNVSANQLQVSIGNNPTTRVSVANGAKSYGDLQNAESEKYFSKIKTIFERFAGVFDLRGAKQLKDIVDRIFGYEDIFQQINANFDLWVHVRFLKISTHVCVQAIKNLQKNGSEVVDFIQRLVLIHKNQDFKPQYVKELTQTQFCYFLYDINCRFGLVFTNEVYSLEIFESVQVELREHVKQQRLQNEIFNFSGNPRFDRKIIGILQNCKEITPIYNRFVQNFLEIHYFELIQLYLVVMCEYLSFLDSTGNRKYQIDSNSTLEFQIQQQSFRPFTFLIFKNKTLQFYQNVNYNDDIVIPIKVSEQVEMVNLISQIQCFQDCKFYVEHDNDIFDVNPFHFLDERPCSILINLAEDQFVYQFHIKNNHQLVTSDVGELVLPRNLTTLELKSIRDRAIDITQNYLGYIQNIEYRQHQLTTQNVEVQYDVKDLQNMSLLLKMRPNIVHTDQLLVQLQLRTVEQSLDSYTGVSSSYATYQEFSVLAPNFRVYLVQSIKKHPLSEFLLQAYESKKRSTNQKFQLYIFCIYIIAKRKEYLENRQFIEMDVLTLNQTLFVFKQMKIPYNKCSYQSSMELENDFEMIIDHEELVKRYKNLQNFQVFDQIFKIGIINPQYELEQKLFNLHTKQSSFIKMAVNSIYDENSTYNVVMQGILFSLSVWIEKTASLLNRKFLSFNQNHLRKAGFFLDMVFSVGFGDDFKNSPLCEAQIFRKINFEIFKQFAKSLTENTYVEKTFGVILPFKILMEVQRVIQASKDFSYLQQIFDRFPIYVNEQDLLQIVVFLLVIIVQQVETDKSNTYLDYSKQECCEFLDFITNRAGIQISRNLDELDSSLKIEKNLLAEGQDCSYQLKQLTTNISRFSRNQSLFREEIYFPNALFKACASKSKHQEFLQSSVTSVNNDCASFNQIFQLAMFLIVNFLKFEQRQANRFFIQLQGEDLINVAASLRRIGFLTDLMFPHSVKELEDSVMQSEKGVYIKVFQLCAIFVSDSKHPILSSEYPFQIKPKTLFIEQLLKQNDKVKELFNQVIDDILSQQMHQEPNIHFQFLIFGIVVLNNYKNTYNKRTYITIQDFRLQKIIQNLSTYVDLAQLQDKHNLSIQEIDDFLENSTEQQLIELYTKITNNLGASFDPDKYTNYLPGNQQFLSVSISNIKSRNDVEKNQIIQVTIFLLYMDIALLDLQLQHSCKDLSYTLYYLIVTSGKVDTNLLNLSIFDQKLFQIEIQLTFKLDDLKISVHQCLKNIDKSQLAEYHKQNYTETEIAYLQDLQNYIDKYIQLSQIQYLDMLISISQLYLKNVSNAPSYTTLNTTAELLDISQIIYLKYGIITLNNQFPDCYETFIQMVTTQKIKQRNLYISQLFNYLYQLQFDTNYLVNQYDCSLEDVKNIQFCDNCTTSFYQYDVLLANFISNLSKIYHFSQDKKYRLYFKIKNCSFKRTQLSFLQDDKQFEQQEQDIRNDEILFSKLEQIFDQYKIDIDATAIKQYFPEIQGAQAVFLHKCVSQIDTEQKLSTNEMIQVTLLYFAYLNAIAVEKDDKFLKLNEQQVSSFMTFCVENNLLSPFVVVKSAQQIQQLLVVKHEVYEIHQWLKNFVFNNSNFAHKYFVLYPGDPLQYFKASMVSADYDTTDLRYLQSIVEKMERDQPLSDTLVCQAFIFVILELSKYQSREIKVVPILPNRVVQNVVSQIQQRQKYDPKFNYQQQKLTDVTFKKDLRPISRLNVGARVDRIVQQTLLQARGKSANVVKRELIQNWQTQYE